MSDTYSMGELAAPDGYSDEPLRITVRPPRGAAADYNTPLQPLDEMAFRQWIDSNKVPFDPKASQSDYDMRGYWRALQSGDPLARSSENPNDSRIHYPDFWKTPQHTSFSNESQWAGPDAPRWTPDDKLVTPGGRVVFDEKSRPAFTEALHRMGATAEQPDPLLPPPSNPATPPEWWNEKVRGAAGKVVDVVTLPGRAMQQGITTEEAVPWAAEVGMGMVGTPATPAGALGSSAKGIRAYHGSPHDFERFDLSRIGTGEGAQMYGHGIYLAENESTARSYRDALKTKSLIDPNAPMTDPRRIAGELYDSWRGDIKGALDDARNAGYGNSRDIIAELRKIQAQPPTGRMYEVNINAHPEQFLDWDKGLHRQSPEVQKALETYGIKAEPDKMREYDDALHRALTSPNTNVRIPQQPYDPTGAQIYESSKLVPGAYRQKAAATNALANVGIPGIKYLDQGSRGHGSGTSNYVVFNDKLIDILRKYAVPGMLAGGGATMGSLAAQDRYAQ